MYMNEQLFETPVRPMGTAAKTVKAATHKFAARMMTLFAVALVIGVLSVCLSLLGGEQDAFAAANAYSAKQSVEVASGDTLWAIANKHAGKGSDVREYMNEMKRLNSLKSNIIYEGQVLLLP